MRGNDREVAKENILPYNIRTINERFYMLSDEKMKIAYIASHLICRHAICLPNGFRDFSASLGF